MKPTNPQTFVCRFSLGGKATLRCDVAALAAVPDSEVVALPPPEFEGVFLKSEFPKLVHWLAESWQAIANGARKALAGTMPDPRGPGPAFVSIVCEPGQKPEIQSNQVFPL